MILKLFLLVQINNTTHQPTPVFSEINCNNIQFLDEDEKNIRINFNNQNLTGELIFIYNYYYLNNQNFNEYGICQYFVTNTPIKITDKLNYIYFFKINNTQNQAISLNIFGYDLLYNFLFFKGFQKNSLVFPYHFRGELFLIKVHNYCHSNTIVKM
jgi:hypothetical protein